MATAQLPAVRVNRAAIVRCEPEWSWHPPAETFGDFDLWFIWAGLGVFRYENETLAVNPGTVLCLRPHLQYHATQDPKHRLGVGYIHFDFLDGSGEAADPKETDLPPRFGRFAKVPFYQGIFRHISELLSKGEESRTRAGRYLSLLLEDYCKDSPADRFSGLEKEHRERMDAVLWHIRENPGQIHSIADLSRLASYSPDYFTRVFARVVGDSPKEYCIQIRLERAQQLMKETRMSLTQIASALGYSDPFFFSRQFKQRMGISPRAWRQEAHQ